jgi:nucleoid-associated protein YgaU
MFRNRYLGRHRAARSSVSARIARDGAVAATAAAAALGAWTGSAAASPAHNWDGVAQCESSGNWHINTGNGFYGGLQFSEATWLGYGGGAYASRADLASPAQQIAIAERVLVGQGVGAWPVCGRHLGASSGGARSHVSAPSATRSPATPRSISVSRGGDRDGDGDEATVRAAAGRQYVVRSGDTLQQIAVRHAILGGWATLLHLNRDVINNPNLIYPGQHLTL